MSSSPFLYNKADSVFSMAGFMLEYLEGYSGAYEPISCATLFGDFVKRLTALLFDIFCLTILALTIYKKFLTEVLYPS